MTSVSPCLVFFGHTDRVGDSLGHGAAVIPVLVPFPTNEQCLGARCRKLDEPWRPLGSPKWISNPSTAKSLIMNIEKNGTKRTCSSHKPGRKKSHLTPVARGVEEEECCFHSQFFTGRDDSTQD